MSATRQLATILFTDIEGYTALMEANEAETVRMLERHREVIEELVARYDGQVIQYFGDGALCLFDDPLKAVQCASEIQVEFRKPPEIPLRIGIHQGAVLRTEDNAIGDSVNLASRIESIGAAGSVLVSETVYQAISNLAAIKAVALGVFQFKNVGRPTRVYAIATAGLSIPQEVDLLDKSKVLSYEYQGPSGLSTPARPGRRMPSFRGGERWRQYSLVLFFVLIALGTASMVFERFGGRLPFGYSWFGQPNRIAVLHFENRTGTDSLDILGKMAADWITEGLVLSGVPHIASARRVTEQLAFARIGADAGLPAEPVIDAQTIVEGAYYLERDSLVFTLSVHNLRSGELVFSYHSPKLAPADPLPGIERMRQEVAGFLVTKDHPILAAAPPAFNAYEEYLAAQDVWNRDFDAALQHLDKALELDSTFLRARFLKAMLFLNLSAYLELDTMVRQIDRRADQLNDQQRNTLRYFKAFLYGHRGEIMQYGLKEYELDPKDLFNNTGMAVLALEYANRPNLALRVLREIDNRQLDYTHCYYCLTRIECLADAYLRLNRPRKALEALDLVDLKTAARPTLEMRIRTLTRLRRTGEIEQLLQQSSKLNLSTDFRYLYFTAAREALLLGRQEECLTFGRQAAALYRDASKPNTIMMARSLYLTGDYEQAESVLMTRYEQNPSNLPTNILMSLVYAHTGRTEQALAVAGRLESLGQPYQMGYIPYHQGPIYAVLGEKEQAVAHLTVAVEQGYPFSFINFANEPDLLPLMDFEPFQELIRPKKN